MGSVEQEVALDELSGMEVSLGEAREKAAEGHASWAEQQSELEEQNDSWRERQASMWSQWEVQIEENVRLEEQTVSTTAEIREIRCELTEACLRCERSTDRITTVSEALSEVEAAESSREKDFGIYEHECEMLREEVHAEMKRNRATCPEAKLMKAAARPGLETVSSTVQELTEARERDNNMWSSEFRQAESKRQKLENEFRTLQKASAATSLSQVEAQHDVLEQRLANTEKRLEQFWAKSCKSELEDLRRAHEELQCRCEELEQQVPRPRLTVTSITSMPGTGAPRFVEQQRTSRRVSPERPCKSPQGFAQERSRANGKSDLVVTPRSSLARSRATSNEQLGCRTTVGKERYGGPGRIEPERGRRASQPCIVVEPCEDEDLRAQLEHLGDFQRTLRARTGTSATRGVAPIARPSSPGALPNHSTHISFEDEELFLNTPRVCEDQVPHEPETSPARLPYPGSVRKSSARPVTPPPVPTTSPSTPPSRRAVGNADTTAATSLRQQASSNQYAERRASKTLRRDVDAAAHRRSFGQSRP